MCVNSFCELVVPAEFGLLPPPPSNLFHGQKGERGEERWERESEEVGEGWK